MRQYLRGVSGAALLAWICIGFVLTGSTHVSAQTFSAQIQNFWNQLRTGALVFTNLRAVNVTVTGTCTGCGGGGTPGGALTSVQFNNAGAFGGFGTWDGTTMTLTNLTATSALSGGQIDASTFSHAGVQFQIGPGGQYVFSDGVDYGAGLSRPAGTVVRTTNGSTGYGEHQAQDFRLVPNGTAQPACAAGIRGTLWYTSSAAGVPDKMEVCAKPTTDVYAWIAMATIP